MNVLVTGSEGFIGKHLVRRLQSEGHDVEGFDIKSGQDVCDPEQVYDAVRGKDVVFHEAAAHLIASRECPGIDLCTNAGGALNVLEAARDHGARVIMASTGSVDASHNGIQNSPYGISKKAAESYAQYWHWHYGVDVTILRYFSVYGPGMPHQHRGVIGIFLAAAIQGKEFNVEGGSQKRAFIYIDDVVEANIVALNSEMHGLIYEVGTDETTTILDLARFIKRKYGGGNIVKKAPRPGDDLRMTADISAWQSYGWCPKTKLSKGVNLTYEWLSQRVFA